MSKDYKINLNRKAVKKKVEEVKATIEEMKQYSTVALVDLHKLPDSLLQKLRKNIRSDGGKVKILKKPVIERVLESNPKLKEKKTYCNKPVGLILTNWSPYKLNSFFKQSKKQRAAKVGDVAPYDIIVPAGDTDLPPGPALSELKAGGVNVQIKAGKIVVAKDSTVAKQGDSITAPKVKALQQLNIMPFEVRASLLFGFDGEYCYAKEILDMGDTIKEDLLTAYNDGFNLSINAAYPTADNADVLLRDAVMQSMNLALNTEVYSSSTVEQLLSSALRQGMALSSLEPAEKKKEKPEAKSDGSDAPAEKAPAEEKK